MRWKKWKPSQTVKKMSKTHYIIPIFVPDLGCPHRCVFCSQKRITGMAGAPSGKKITDTIEQYLRTIPDKTGIRKEVAFYGGSFTAVDISLQIELLSPAYRFLSAGKIDGIRVSTRPDALSEEKMALLSTYGVDTVELGVQSMDDVVLYQSGRGHTSRDVLRAAALVRTWGMKLGLQVMVGLPGDTEEKDISTATDLRAMRPDLVRIYPCLVLRETPMADMFRKGEYVPLTLEDAVERCKKMLLIFASAGINVIRIGLQPSEQINLAGSVLAGPYHPAFRELVESALACDQLDILLSERAGINAADTVEVAVNERDISAVRGHNGRNVKFLRHKYGIRELITFADSQLGRGAIRLVTIDGIDYRYTMSRTDLAAKYETRVH